MSSWSELDGGRWLAMPANASLASGMVVCLPRPEDGLTPFGNWPSAVAVDQADPAGNVALLRLAHYPGDRDPDWWHEHPTIEEQARDLAEELRDRSATEVVLFGHGVSALVVYEVAAELARDSDHAVGRLIVSDCPAPTRAGRASPPPTEDDILEHALTISLESGTSPLPTLMEKTVRALRAQAAALCSYRSAQPARLNVDLCVVRWRSERAAAADRRRRDDEPCDPAVMADWAACGPARFFDVDAAPTAFVELPAGLLHVLAGTHPEGGPAT